MGRSAADALRASPRLTTVFAQAPSDPAALTETARTINGPNGVLAAIAFRMLLDGPVPFASRAATVTHTGDLRKLSVFVYLILFGSTAKDYGEWLAEIRRLVDETGDPERLLAIARAGFAASLFATRNPPAAAAARQMLDDLRRRADQLGMPRREDSQLFLILKKTGLL